jgi:hypothetical protein
VVELDAIDLVLERNLRYCMLPSSHRGNLRSSSLDRSQAVNLL